MIKQIWDTVFDIYQDRLILRPSFRDRMEFGLTMMLFYDFLCLSVESPQAGNYKWCELCMPNLIRRESAQKEVSRRFRVVALDTWMIGDLLPGKKQP